MELPIVICDPVVPRPPGKCDVEDCMERARYSFGNLYVCAPCLIAACTAGFVKAGAVVYRVDEYQRGA